MTKAGATCAAATSVEVVGPVRIGQPEDQRADAKSTAIELRRNLRPALGPGIGRLAVMRPIGKLENALVILYGP